MNESVDSRVVRAVDPLVIANGPGTENLCVLYLEGALRAPVDNVLRHRIQDLLRVGERAIVLDLAHVWAIDAAGVGHLVRLYNQLSAVGKLRIVHATPRVREMLERAGLFTLLSAWRG